MVVRAAELAPNKGDTGMMWGGRRKHASKVCGVNICVHIASSNLQNPTYKYEDSQTRFIMHVKI